jgi:allantoinase
MPDFSHFKSKSSGHASVVVRGKRIVTSEGERAASIHIVDGIIAEISDFADLPENSNVYEAEENVVLPGLVDAHVHINEPGRAEWEGFATATRAAAAGGVTTLIEMPLNSVPATTKVEGFQQKIASTQEKLSVDVGFWGGVVPGNAGEIRHLWEAGCFGFKCFLIESGVEEFGWVKEANLRVALPELVKIGAPLLAHAELPGPIAQAVAARNPEASSRQYATWLASRPRSAENEAIDLLMRLSEEFGVHVHVVHLSSSDAAATLRVKKASGARISVETCPHYLTFFADDIRDGATEFKCAPPIRERKNCEELWAALGNGTIDLIATDHSPCPPEMKLQKEGDFLRAWGGIASLQVSSAAVWTEARSRGYSLTQVAEWMSAAPARLAGLNHRKGSIAKGFDGDLVIFDPDATFRVDGNKLEHRHKLTPYQGRQLRGTVLATFLRGQQIFERGEFRGAPAGKVLLRGKV